MLGGATLLAHIYSLNQIKSRTVGDGQHGTARWANSGEIKKIYKYVPFTPNRWHKRAAEGKTPIVAKIVKKGLFSKLKKKKDEVPEAVPQGIVVGCKGGNKNTIAMVDTGDVHALMIGVAGVVKQPIGYTRVSNMPVHQVCPSYRPIQRVTLCETTVISQSSMATTFRL